MQAPKIIKKFQFVAVLTILFVFIYISPVFAKTYCQTTAPYQNLYLIPLKSVYKTPIYPLAERKIADEILYESVYIRQFNGPLVNVVITDDLYFLTCKDFDIVLPSLLINKKTPGMLVLYSKWNDQLVQKLVDAYHFQSIVLVKLQIEGGKIYLNGQVECKNLCKNINLPKNWLEARGYDFEFTDVAYPAQIKQLEELQVLVKIKNISKLPYPPYKYVPLQLIKLQGNNIYDASWKSPTVVGNINGDSYWEPDTVVEYKFTLGKFLLPGKYKAVFGLRLGSFPVKKEHKFVVNFEVKDKGLKLGEIRPRQGDIANVRKEPGLRAKVLFRLERGDIVIWHKQEGAWVYIETKEGKKGWVYRPFVWPI